MEKGENMKPQQQVGTIVGSSVHLTGAIKDSSDITIFGSVEGEVVSESKIIIEDSAYVKGPITADEVLVSGNVVGTIVAKSRLELNPSGTIKGNIETKNLLINSGATFIGKCTMPDKKSSGEKESDKKEDFKAEVEEVDESRDILEDQK